MFFVPETPHFLLAKGRTEKAASALQWLRGAPSPQDVEQELKEVCNKCLQKFKPATVVSNEVLGLKFIKQTTEFCHLHVDSSRY